MEINLLNQNPQWSGLLPPTPPHYRDLFNHLVLHRLNDDLIVLITGPRRTGKSVILRQLQAHLQSNKRVDPHQILFFQFSPQDTLDTINHVYQQFATQIADPAQLHYLFFDEIQYVKNYESAIKLIYDLNKGKVKIFLTGSLSISYKKRMQESLAGRFLEHKLFPLSYDEYLKFTDSTSHKLFRQLKNSTDLIFQSVFAKEHRVKFENFLKYHRLPEAISFNDPQKSSLYTETIIQQSLNQDALSYFSIGNSQVFNALFRYLTQHNGTEISVNNLATNLYSVSPITLSGYLDIYEIMGLIYLVKNTLDPLKSLHATKKVYLSSHLSDSNTNIGYLVESYCLEQLLTQLQPVTYFRYRHQEVDFLLPKTKQALEIKFQSQITSKDSKYLINFCNQHHYSPTLITSFSSGSTSIPHLPAIFI